MAGDFYPSMEDLKAAEEEGVDFAIEAQPKDRTLIMAPHGGAIEGGTTELARAIAGDDHSYYSFLGLKGSGNAKLHITSTKFIDEDMCRALLQTSDRVVALHGVREGDVAYVGGLDAELRQRIVEALERHGIPVSTESPDGLGGVSPRNVCNQGTREQGVQIEVALELRKRMFGGSTSAEARASEDRDPLFVAFVDAIREALS